MALNSFKVDGSPFSVLEGITISGVITMRIVVVVGNEVGIVGAVDVDCEDEKVFLSNSASLYSIEPRSASLFFSFSV